MVDTVEARGRGRYRPGVPWSAGDPRPPLRARLDAARGAGVVRLARLAQFRLRARLAARGYPAVGDAGPLAAAGCLEAATRSLADAPVRPLVPDDPFRALWVTGEELSLVGGLERARPRAAVAQIHLHGFEWAALAAGADLPQRVHAPRLAVLLEEWFDLARDRRLCGYALHPFTASLRVWSLAHLVERGYLDGLAAQRVASTILRADVELVRRAPELHLRGNHYLKNLKARVAAAVVTGADSGPPIAAFRAEANRQVRADGGHAERTPRYHLQVLADVLDVARVARVARHRSDANDLDALAGRMQAWLHVVTAPDGTMVPFNDSDRTELTSASELSGPRRAGASLRVARESGFVRAGAGQLSLYVDAGGPPTDVHPGHSHAGILGFELWRGDEPILVEAGSSTYGTSERRSYERSAAGHNSLRVDGSDLVSVWGDFRVAEIPTVRLTEAAKGDAEVRLAVECVARRGFTVTRRWCLTADGVEIIDEIAARRRTGAVPVELFLHGAPGLDGWHVDGDAVEVPGVGRIVRDPRLEAEVLGDGSVAHGWGELRPSTTLVLRGAVVAPASLRTRISVSPRA